MSVSYPPDFDRAMSWLWPIEGVYWPGGKTDPNPTKYGITQRTYDSVRMRLRLADIQVIDLNKPTATLIYFHEYWTPAGCYKLGWPIDLIVFDMAVNCGVGNAQKILALTKDPATYIACRRVYYQQVAQDKPAYAPNLPGWNKRLDKLEVVCGIK